MSISKEIYICSNCKKKIDSIDDVLVIEEFYCRPYCSESCILEFNSGYIDHFEMEYRSLLKRIGHSESSQIERLASDNRVITETIGSPDKVLIEENDLAEEYYTLIRKIADEELYSVAIALIYEERPSMVLFHTVTTNSQVVENYSTGDEVESFETSEAAGVSYEIAPEIIEEIELKKSQYLSLLLEKRLESDISFEEFPKYDKYLKNTLSDPDEIYETYDDEDDQILTYIKGYQDKNLAFFYIAVCMKLDEDEQTNEDILVPIVSFPSKDGELYEYYKKGKRISGALKS